MIKDKFTETYLNIIKQWYDGSDYWREQQAIKDRAYNKYIHTDFRDPQETDPIQEYQEWMGDHVGDYLNDASKAQEINDQLDYNFSQEQWDALSPEEKTKEVIRIIIDKAGCDPYELMDTYHMSWERVTGIEDKWTFKDWCDDLKTCYDGEFDFFKQEEDQPEQQIEECGGGPGGGAPGGAPCGGPGPGPGGPAGGPPPANIAAAANPPNMPSPPPPPKPVAGIGHCAIRPLLVPAIPYGWYSRGYSNPYAKTTTKKKKKKKVKRKKKSK